MRKLNLTAQELKALYPPMSEAFNHTVQNTLHHLEHGKECPKVKKKMSAALVVAVLLLIVTVSAAIALTQSNLLGVMFGGNGQAPEELEEIVSKPEATVTTPDAKVTLSEYLYDGEKLHLYWTIANQTDRQIMVTMAPFRVNGKDVNTDGIPTFQSNDVHAWGKILGGEVGGAALPNSVNCFGTYINPWEQENGYHTFTKGETLEIISELYIWELLSAPDPAIPDHSQVQEGFLNVEALRGIPTDRSGLCGLGWLLLNDNSIDIYDAKANQSMYEKNNWARMIFEQPVKFSITLDTKSLKQAEPVKTVFETDDFALNINRMAYTSTGGTLVLHVTPKAQGSKTNGDALDGYDFAVLDADTKELLSDYTPYTAGGPDYTVYNIVLKPVPGVMPKDILIVPAVYNPKWDKHSENYDPNVSPNPYNDSLYKYNMENAVKVELEWQ